MATADVIPGGSLDNLDHVSPHIDWSDDRSRIDRVLLADAQTSGGLLIALPTDSAETLLQSLRDRQVGSASLIGHFSSNGEGEIKV